MVNRQQLMPQNARERQFLLLGLVAVFLGLYFFVIEPLDKKAAQQQNNAETRLMQLNEMQRMTSELLSQSTMAPRQLLQGKIAGEVLEDGKRLLKTTPLSDAEAKQLLQQLAPYGKVVIHSTEASFQEVWFWPE